MKLTELDPRWCVAGPGERHGMGISFECPVHRDHRLAVMFANPIDGLPKCEGPKYTWQRTGETFDVLTLGPSIDASGNLAFPFGDNSHKIQTPCWHGWITNGEVTSS